MLAGGTGGAKLAAGVQAAAPDAHLTVIANIADDDRFWGLLVCPDIDAVLYRLAGIFNEKAGYGVADDTYHVLEALQRAGEDTWFHLGDRDFATHLLRTELLRASKTLTEVSLELGKRMGVAARVIPPTDESVRTRFTTERGVFSLQEYFVRERLVPRLLRIEFAGIDSARPTSHAVESLGQADVVLIGPSNPLISVAPMLKVIGQHLPRERSIVVTPIVAGASLKGPTVDMMVALGLEPSPVTVAKMYADVASRFVLDSRDVAEAGAIEALGYRLLVGDTVMSDGGKRLAAEILASV